MGCDIHAVIERRAKTYGDGHEWLHSGDPNIGRNYDIFAALAGVRNGVGMVPVAEPRGLPAFESWAEFSNGERWIKFDADKRSDRPCSEMVSMAERYGVDGHSASWLTLAELKAFDTEQVVHDDRLILAKDDDGRVTAMCAATSGEHLGPVGETKILRWPGEDEPTAWLRLIRYMEQAKWDGQTDDEVRLVFFFDN